MLDTYIRRVLLRKSLIVSALMLTIIGCRGVDSRGGIGDDQGEVELWLSATPAENVDRLEIIINAVAYKPQGGDPIEVELDRPLEVDLQRLLNRSGMRQEILDESLPIGDYEWIRLVLDERITLTPKGSGNEYQVEIPAGEESGLQMNFNVKVEDDTDLDLTINMELPKSLRDPIDPDAADPVYRWFPDLRVVRTDRSGHLEGGVSPEVVDECRDNALDTEGNAVYLFAGSDVAFQDLRGNANDPVAVAVVDWDSIADEYNFRLSFLQSGTYTAVFTCDAEDDDPLVDNLLDMEFSETLNVDVEADESTLLFIEE